MDKDKYEDSYEDEDENANADDEEAYEDDSELIDEDDYETINKLEGEKKGSFGYGCGMAVIGYIVVACIFYALSFLAKNEPDNEFANPIYLWQWQILFFGIMWAVIGIILGAISKNIGKRAVIWCIVSAAVGTLFLVSSCDGIIR